jgi:NADPH:quinone reductase-like Zn-dependent oxidoreductase
MKGYGGSDVIEINRNNSVPDPSGGKVLVTVKAAGVNPIDWKTREGYMMQAMQRQFPLTIGMDFSGIVEKVRAEVSAISQGNEVYGQASVLRGDTGAFAEMALANADSIAHKPKSLNHQEAAGLPLVGVNAWQALVETMGLTNSQKILIHGGAGGIQKV